MIQLKEKLGTEYRYSEDLFTKTIDDRPEMLKDTEYALKIMSAYKEVAEEDLQKISGMTRKEYQMEYGLPKNYTEPEKKYYMRLSDFYLQLLLLYLLRAFQILLLK